MSWHDEMPAMLEAAHWQEQQLQIPGQPLTPPTPAQIDRARSIARGVIEKLDADGGWSLGAVVGAASAVGGLAGRVLLDVIDRAGPIAAQLAADAAVAYIESRRRK